jgi:uncharacterized SAM-binding protein YcdF (DUF218 family)
MLLVAFVLFAVVAVLGVVLVLNGITMLKREGYKFSNALSLVLGAGILLYLLAMLVMFVTSSFATGFADELFKWLFFLAFPIGYLAYGFLAYLLYSWLYQSFTRRFAKPADAVIVLGAGLSKTGGVTPLLASRCDTGADEFRRSQAAGKHPFMITSGGQGPDEPVPEASAMADYLIGKGIPADSVRTEDFSRNTSENLLNSKDLLLADDLLNKQSRIGVVTSNFHAFRAALLMRQAGIPGFVVGSPTAGYYWPSASIREYVAILRDHKVLNAFGLGLSFGPLLLVLANTFVMV